MFGTIAGLGNWLSQVLKSAFALVGMGAYLALLLDLPIEPVAVAFTVVFAGLNLLGVKNATSVQIALVGLVLATLVYVLGAALLETGRASRPRDPSSPRASAASWPPRAWCSCPTPA
jgi:amino acid transporter